MSHLDTFTTCGIIRAAAMEVALQAERSRDFRPMLNGLTVGLSSGTSGHRGLFLASPWEQAAWAGTILAQALHRLPAHRLRVAFFLRSNSNLDEKTNEIPVAKEVLPTLAIGKRVCTADALHTHADVLLTVSGSDNLLA